MKTITRKTAVISVSLPKAVVKSLEATRKRTGQSRSAFVASLIEKRGEDARWERIYRKGSETARRLKITSEDDIDRLLHGREI